VKLNVPVGAICLPSLPAPSHPAHAQSWYPIDETRGSKYLIKFSLATLFA
jgi:hypothetical protein